MGQQGFVGRLGALSLSLVIALNERIPGLPLIAFAIPCIFTALQCRQILPETQGKPLLNTIAEVDRGGERGFSKKEIFLLIVFPMLTCLVTPAVKYDKLPTYINVFLSTTAQIRAPQVRVGRWWRVGRKEVYGRYKRKGMTPLQLVSTRVNTGDS